METAEQLLRKSLNIGFEWSILEEATQVIDELQIMQEIFLQQIRVMAELSKVLQVAADLAEKSAAAKFTREDVTAEEPEDGRRKAIERIESITLDMTQRLEELQSMEKLQHKTRQQVRLFVTGIDFVY